jgi:hypothetical protein
LRELVAFKSNPFRRRFCAAAIALVIISEKAICLLPYSFFQMISVRDQTWGQGVAVGAAFFFINLAVADAGWRARAIRFISLKWSKVTMLMSGGIKPPFSRKGPLMGRK